MALVKKMISPRSTETRLQFSRPTCRFAIVKIVPWKSSTHKKPGANSMAKPIEIGPVLEEDDARRFHKYMENPKITKEGCNLIREAIKIAKSEKNYA